ncbi:MAG: 4-hydroxyphenylpyruvate dioxygenase [Tumebacillaceae bacterium]
MAQLPNERLSVLSKNDVLPVEDIDYIELYTGNAKQTAFYYAKLFGFEIVAYSGLETGNREKVSYLLQQGDIRVLISGTYNPDHEIADYIKKHGDSVKDIALRVQNVEQTYRDAIKRGGIALQEPYEVTDEYGVLKKAVIGAYGDTVHTLIERTAYNHVFAPGFIEVKDPAPVQNAGLLRFDHVAVNVENMDERTAYYAKVFGFHMIAEFKKEDVSSAKSSLMTKALQNGTERVKFVIVEPAAGQKKSQVQEFLDYNHGAGVQHIALETDDIIAAVDTLERNGIKFLFTPDSYYEMMPERVGEIEESIDELSRLNILVDRDEEGYLLQIFGPPMHDRPTMFFEIIQRRGSRGFGNGNIRALFEAVEREQEKRGNL